MTSLKDDEPTKIALKTKQYKFLSYHIYLGVSVCLLSFLHLVLGISYTYSKRMLLFRNGMPNRSKWRFLYFEINPFFLKKIAAYNRLNRKPTVIMRCSRLWGDGDHLEMVFVWWWRRLLLISQPPHEVKINHSCDFKSRKLWGALSRLITPWTTFEFGCQNDNWNWIINLILAKKMT